MKTAGVVAGLAAMAAAQTRPMNTSICDYYTTALLKENTAANQLALVTLVVNTAVIGNYTQPNVGIKVAGILAPGTVNGTAVNLLPYFNGGLASSNRGGNAGVAVNFLDDGGAEPLMKNMAANGQNSNQYKLLTHLYQYFGALLGCSAMDYPAYMGQASMGRVHKFMDIDVYENTYFIQQVGMSAASFGVAEADIAIVAAALVKFFNYKCAPATTIIPSQGAQPQSICQAANCPLAEMSNCDLYPGSGVMPAVANQSLVPSTSGSGSPSATSATSTPTFTGAAAKAGYGLGAGVLAIAAFIL